MATEAQYFATYWENDTVMNPVIVRVLDRSGDFFTVGLPAGAGIRQVHLHTLGVIRRAS